MGEPIPFAPWNAVPEVWDRVAFDDEQSPGVAAVTISRSNKWDTQKAQASHGAKRDFKGSDLATVKIQIRFIYADDYVDFCERILPIIEPDPGKKKPTVIRLDHATAWARNLRTITIDTVSGPEIQGGIGVFDIDATEHREPDKTNAGGKPGTGKGAKCQEIAATLAVLDTQRVLWETLRAQAANPFSLDPVMLGQAELQLVNIDAQRGPLLAAQEANGCVGPPGGFLDPTENLLF